MYIVDLNITLLLYDLCLFTKEQYGELITIKSIIIIFYLTRGTELIPFYIYFAMVAILFN